MKLRQYLRVKYWHGKPVVDRSCGKYYYTAYTPFLSRDKVKKGMICCAYKDYMHILGKQVPCYRLKLIHYSHLDVCESKVDIN